MTELAYFEMSSYLSRYDTTENPLYMFRQDIFHRTKELFCQVFNTIETPNRADLREFWVPMRDYLSNVTPESIEILLHYYRVSFAFRLFDYVVICQFSARRSLFRTSAPSYVTIALYWILEFTRALSRD